MAINAIWKGKNFAVGDTVSVGLRLVEGGKERVQVFKGVVLGIRGSGCDKTFIVRKEGAGGVGIERIFPLESPWIADISVDQKAVRVKRAKLYYLRDEQSKMGIRKLYQVRETVKKEKKTRVIRKKAQTAKRDKKKSAK